jgi:hypothetical protein
MAIAYYGYGYPYRFTAMPAVLRLSYPYYGYSDPYRYYGYRDRY